MLYSGRSQKSVQLAPGNVLNTDTFPAFVALLDIWSSIWANELTFE